MPAEFDLLHVVRILGFIFRAIDNPDIMNSTYSDLLTPN